MNTQPLVSVRLVTYNHEKWIAQCLEGILMQRTDFPFEVIVGEDCSTDRTREIVLAYAERHPEKIRVLPAEANLGHMRNSYRVQQACRGKYQAMIEGDDYWIDPLKLQKQTDFLETHPDHSLCVHNVFIIYEGSAKVQLHLRTPPPQTLTINDLRRVRTPLLTHLARSDVLASLPEWRLNVSNGDVLFRLWCGHHGKIGYLNEVMGVYRSHCDGLTARFLADREEWFAGSVYLLEQFDRETNYQHTDLVRSMISDRRRVLRRRQLGRCYYLVHPREFISRLMNYVQAVRRHRDAV